MTSKEFEVMRKAQKQETDLAILRELDSIRAEIDTLYGVYLSRFTERLVIKTDVMQILDRHISELKGGAE